jgi:hypothetical protein
MTLILAIFFSPPLPFGTTISILPKLFYRLFPSPIASFIRNIDPSFLAFSSSAPMGE